MILRLPCLRPERARNLAATLAQLDAMLASARRMTDEARALVPDGPQPWDGIERRSHRAQRARQP